MNPRNRLTIAAVALSLLAGYSVQAQTSGQQDHSPRVQETKSSGAGVTRLATPPLLLFGAIPVSTRSPEARKYAEVALDKYENVLLHEANIQIHKATEADRNFAFGWALQAYISRASTVDQNALTRAKQLLPIATPDEQLIIRFMINVQDRNLLPAISSMNDLLHHYPKNKYMLYLASDWLYNQEDFDRSQKMMESVLEIDPKFPPVLNMLGYSYIESGMPNPQKAVAMLKKNAEVDPTSPNPEDSLAEVLRYTGDDEGSLQHYTAALQIDPTFFTSQLGLGDTSTLMGRYPEARENYDKAVLMSESDRDLLHALFQKALVNFWEGQPEAGRKALAELGAKAAAKKEPNGQFEIAFGSAMLAADYQSELQQLQALEKQLTENNADGMTGADRNADLAKLRCEIARIASQHGLHDVAEQATSRLAQAAAQTGDLLVGNNYETARGYLLMSQGDFVNAADELSSARRSPLAMQQLIIAQQKSKDQSAASDTQIQLKYMRAPTVEWFLYSHSSSAAAMASN
jgi:tetratricopeptide (TPR) repeat protein